MSLLVWLPMTKDLSNQGLENITITNSGATLDANGKLGKCYSFNGSSQYLRINEKLIDNAQYTISFWMYATNVSANHCIFSTRNVNNGAVNIYLLSTGLRFDNGTNWATGFKPTVNTWYHIAFVQDTANVYLYVNGILNTSTSATTTLSQVSSVCTIGCEHINGSSIGTYFAGKLNDFRIYDHALSPKEVEVLSRGLVCHYPLNDNSIQHMSNSYSNPTFTAIAGWGFWGNTGHSGHYGLNTDKQFIYNKNQINSCWVSDDSGATAPYLIYQSPNFDGGYRSMCAVIKESNNKPITESIAYPAWNASVSGGLPSGKWTSINSLGDGFYLCKVEGFQQDGSNNLVGIYVKPGYKIYISEMYLENDRTICSDILYPSTTVYDCSGFQNNGTPWSYDSTGSITVSKDTARYSASTFINSDNPSSGQAAGTRYIYGNCELTKPEKLTLAFWCKPITGYGGSTSHGIFSLTNYDIGQNAGVDYQEAPLNHRDGAFDVNGISGSTYVHKRLRVDFTANQWHHYAVTYDGRYAKMYKDGIQTSTVDMGSTIPLGDMKGIVIGFSKAGGVWRHVQSYYSDVRLYATALSASQVAELYNTAVSVANNGALMGYELVEV